jgi:hypothetical protein
MRSTTLASKVKENTAADVRLMTPPIVVASRMEMSVESILKPRAHGVHHLQTGHCNVRSGFLPVGSHGG